MNIHPYVSAMQKVHVLSYLSYYLFKLALVTARRGDVKTEDSVMTTYLITLSVIVKRDSMEPSVKMVICFVLLNYFSLYVNNGFNKFSNPVSSTL